MLIVPVFPRAPQVPGRRPGRAHAGQSADGGPPAEDAAGGDHTASPHRPADGLPGLSRRPVHVHPTHGRGERKSFGHWYTRGAVMIGDVWL